jgi:hypothetical protein
VKKNRKLVSMISGDSIISGERVEVRHGRRNAGGMVAIYSA